MRAFSLSALALAALLPAACSTSEARPTPTSGDATTTAAATPAADHHAGGDHDGASCSADHSSEHGSHETKTASSNDREHVDADGVVRRGSPLTAALEATPISMAVTKAKELDGKTVKLTGKVSDVCTRMGCWFVLQGDKPEDKIRISTKAHNIFVPRSAVGMTATVEGTFAVKVIDAKTAQHYEDERELQPGEQRKTITADVNELAIFVTGLEMKKQG